MRPSCILYACLVLCFALRADAWVCDITLIGNTSQPQALAFSTADLRCTPGANESGQTLTAWVSRPLLPANFQGKSINEVASQALITYLNEHHLRIRPWVRARTHASGQGLAHLLPLAAKHCELVS